MKVDVILGLQWGDEGKGKIVDVLSPNYDITARFQGGPNAGHTIEFNGQKFVLHTIPSGIFHPGKLNLIGNGVIIDPFIFSKEVEKLALSGIQAMNNLLISKKAHLILPSHRLLDAVYEASKGDKKIGSTLKGIGPTYTDKIARLGIRVGDLARNDFQEKYKTLRDKHFQIVKSFGFDYSALKFDGVSFEEYENKWMQSITQLRLFKLVDSEVFINQQLAEGKTILAEGAQGTMLDVDFGSYPFVTSSSTICAGVCSGLGIAPSKVGKVFGVFKAYCTRVGSGPFPTELFDKTGELLRTEGHEFGATTGRPRRCGWLDLVALKHSVMLNGVTDLVMTKSDVLRIFDELKVSTKYRLDESEIDFVPFECENLDPVYESIAGWNIPLDQITNEDRLPVELMGYISFIEEFTGVRISVVSVGPDRLQTIFR
jgi:adenylosuccinate synthase